MALFFSVVFDVSILKKSLIVNSNPFIPVEQNLYNNNVMEIYVSITIKFHITVSHFDNSHSIYHECEVFCHVYFDF